MAVYELERFVTKQQEFFQQALAEIRAGRKRTHWSWFIIPQLRALGHSQRALYYGIASLEEAKAYIREPYLRENLITFCRALLALDKKDPEVIMGEIDCLKLASCCTLFEAAAPDIPEFSQVLDKLYDGRRDLKTLSILKKQCLNET